MYKVFTSRRCVSWLKIKSFLCFLLPNEAETLSWRERSNGYNRRKLIYDYDCWYHDESMVWWQVYTNTRSGYYNYRRRNTSCVIRIQHVWNDSILRVIRKIFLLERRLELRTLGLLDPRSNQLSYTSLRYYIVKHIHIYIHIHIYQLIISGVCV